MTQLTTITLTDLLPNVFIGMEDTERIRHSQVWEAGRVALQRGCKICVQAESGCGKSSLLSFIYGNRSDYRGRIDFNGQDTHTFGVEQWCDLRIRHLALLPQEMRLFPELTVMQNIELKNSLTHHKTTAEIEELLARFGIAEKRDVRLGLLSIGQQQRVALIRTVCQPFDFVFLDEPVSHLDATNNRIAASIVEEEAAKQGAGIITTSVGQHLLLNDAKFIAL